MENVSGWERELTPSHCIHVKLGSEELTSAQHCRVWWLTVFGARHRLARMNNVSSGVV